MSVTKAILGFPEYLPVAQQLATELQLPCLETKIHRFPDQESNITLPDTLPEELILCRSLYQPNDKLIELMFIARTVRDKGVKRLTLVTPYLCYMRQDMAFHPGEVISQQIIGRFLAELFDVVITVDPHLHRINNLSDAIPGIPAISLTATQPLGAFLAQQDKDFFLLGPDEESAQWVAAIADANANKSTYDYAIAHKTRHSDKKVTVSLPEINVIGRDVVLVDDMVSTGHTMIETAQQLQTMQVNSISCLVTHPLFRDDALPAMQQSGITAIWSSDAIPHPTNCIKLAPMLADAVNKLTD